MVPSDLAAESYCLGLAHALGVDPSRLVIPAGMSKPEFVAEHRRRVDIDGEAFWDSEGFIDPGCVQAAAGAVTIDDVFAAIDGMVWEAERRWREEDEFREFARGSFDPHRVQSAPDSSSLTFSEYRDQVVRAMARSLGVPEELVSGDDRDPSALCVCGLTRRQHETGWPACRGFTAAAHVSAVSDTGNTSGI